MTSDDPHEDRIMSDRELAREWAAARYTAHMDWRNPAERGFLAGLSLGRTGLTWTGTPPDREGQWWFRHSPGDHPRILEVGETSNGLWVIGWIPSFASIKKLHPACQWSSAPIPAPREPT